MNPLPASRANRRSFLKRSVLQMGALGTAGFGLADMLRMRAEAGEGVTPPDTSVIFIWLPGGPPHMEMYDMKPQAPSTHRGEFRPVATNVPGIDVCELMPHHTRCADRYTLIRSISHGFADHGGGHKRFLTGRKPMTPVGFVNDAPMAGSIVAKLREGIDRGVPNYISGTSAGRAGVDTYSFGAAYLGPAYAPFNIPGDPSDPKFQVKNISLLNSVEGRLDDRMKLLGDFDKLRRQVDTTGLMDAQDVYHRKAVELLTTNKMRQAMDLAEEPEKLRDRYGRHAWGQRALLARRLVEAGSSFVTMVMENPYTSGVPWLKAGTYNWDSHAVNCHIFNDAQVRLPLYDQAVTALVEDIYNRGLDKKVLLVVTGEFGRTPKLSTNTGTKTGVTQPGRDHWPRAMSMLVAGGGMRTGQVVGATNDKGEYPKERPLSPNDLWATVYRHLGVNPEHSFPDLSGRPMPILPSGKPIEELL